MVTKRIHIFGTQIGARAILLPVLTNFVPESEWLYLVHRGDWPTPMRKEAKMFLVPPAKLANSGMVWGALGMSDEDITEKSQAINVYKSQIRTLKPLMTAFERKNELFGEYPDIKLPYFNHDDAAIKPQGDNLTIADPLQDILNLEISRSADISEIHTELSNTGKLHIFLTVDHKPDQMLIYHINLIFFKDTEIARYDFEIINDKITMAPLSKQIIEDMTVVSLDEYGNTLHPVLPANMTEGFDHIYINGCSSTQDHLIDKSAWRMLVK